MSESLKLWHRLSRWPAGRWLYGRLICFKAPYFATIAPRFVALAPGRWRRGAARSRYATAAACTITSAPCTRSRCATSPS